MMNEITGCVMADVAGLTLTAEEKDFLQHPQLGGIILFARNYQSPEQVTDLVASIREARKAPLLITVDQEGGRVQRFRESFTRLPEAGCFGDQYDEDQEKGLSLAKQGGWLMAAEVLATGVDLSFAPILDLYNSNSSVIGRRAFHATPQGVCALAGAFIQGMKEAGMAAVGKHFPGHGTVVGDSHTECPVDERAYEALEQSDLIPFAELSHQIAGVMPAHVIYPGVDSLPAGFSQYWLQTVLRKQFGFQGAIFSDDLSMEGAAQQGGFRARADAALEAGCDMLLVCNQPGAALQVLQHLESVEVPGLGQRLAPLQGQFQWDRATLQASEQWRAAKEAVSALVTE